MNASDNAGDIALLALGPPAAVAPSAQRPSASPFSRLSMDPLLLVMQHCDTHSLLAVARCSRSTLEAASYSFAWIHAPHVVVDIALFDRGDPPLRRLWNRFRYQIGRPLEMPRLPPPSLCARPAGTGAFRPPLDHANKCVRWSCNDDPDFARIVDWNRLRTAYRLLPTLPRLVALDMTDVCTGWWRIDSCVLALHGLTQLDAGDSQLFDHEVRALVAQMPQLRKLRCSPRVDALECLQPLTQLPLLTDLGLRARGLDGTVEDFAVLGNCPRLRRLAFCDAGNIQLPLFLQAPGLQSLRELSLTHEPRQADDSQASWEAAGANLQSLRCLTLELLHSHLSRTILAAVAAGGFPALVHLRIVSGAISAMPVSKYDRFPYRHPFESDEGLGQSIRELFWHRPGIRVELRVRFAHAAVSASWLLPAPPRDFLSAVPRWTDFQVLTEIRKRSRSTYPSSQFADDGLGRQAPLDDD